MSRWGAVVRAALVLAVLLLGLLWARSLHRVSPVTHVSIAPKQLIADGYDTAVLTIDGGPQPRITIDPPHAATVEEVTATDHGWQARVRAGVTPAAIAVRVDAAHALLTTTLAAADTAGDGTPDFLRLDDGDDQRTFRRYFTFLAETQYFRTAAQRPVEIVDCAALIRYAYREALRAHDGNWATAARLPLVPGAASVGKYQYPYTPLGASLFRVNAGAFQPADLAAGGFAQFADAKTLQLRNTNFLTRDVERAQPGDLLFFRQAAGHMPFHTMIYLGSSQIERDSGRYLVYHTGPGDDGPGEIRRPTLDELRHFPDSDWRPLPENPRFLGVYRWNILRSLS